MKVCIICEADVGGKSADRVKDDRVIQLIRYIKGALRIARNNELFVCQDCRDKHKARRKDFEKMVLYASVFAGLVLILLLGRMLLGGLLDPLALVSAFVLALFVLSLPLFKYVPATEPASRPQAPPPAEPEVKPPSPPVKGRKRSRSR